MSVIIKCRDCGKRLRIKGEYIGKRIRCPACKQVQEVARQDVVAMAPRSNDISPGAPVGGGSESHDKATAEVSASERSQVGDEQISSVFTTDQHPDSSGTQAETSPPKIVLGIIVLLFGVVCMATSLTVTLCFLEIDNAINPLSMPMLAGGVIMTLTGYPISRRGTLVRVVFLLLMSILPGYVVLKGWDIIAEGRGV